MAPEFVRLHPMTYLLLIVLLETSVMVMLPVLGAGKGYCELRVGKGEDLGGCVCISRYP